MAFEEKIIEQLKDLATAGVNVQLQVTVPLIDGSQLQDALDQVTGGNSGGGGGNEQPANPYINYRKMKFESLNQTAVLLRNENGGIHDEEVARLRHNDVVDVLRFYGNTYGDDLRLVRVADLGDLSEDAGGQLGAEGWLRLSGDFELIELG